MKRKLQPYVISLVMLAGAFLLSIAVGSVFIPPGELVKIFLGQPSSFSQASTFRVIVLDLRLPRTLLLLLVGAALSGSGAAFQGLFRNPLADPYLIGVASGAGLGAVIAMSFKMPGGPLGLMGVPLAALIGASLTVLLVYELARVGRTLPTTNLILAGVAASSFTTAATSFIMINATGEIRRALIWMLGGSTLTGWQPVFAALPYIIIGLGILLTMGHSLNVLQFGDEQAEQLGIKVMRTRELIILAASVSTAAAVAFAGVIGFVGLIVPHLVRLLWSNDYRRILPLSMLGGASLLLVSDVIARVVMAPQELPVGIITALAGAPFFFWVLRRAKQQNYW